MPHRSNGGGSTSHAIFQLCLCSFEYSVYKLLKWRWNLSINVVVGNVRVGSDSVVLPLLSRRLFSQTLHFPDWASQLFLHLQFVSLILDVALSAFSEEDTASTILPATKRERSNAIPSRTMRGKSEASDLLTESIMV
mmetsp:Transcript_9974/g.22109  ORF Transcript_9974/g.22109 Transcript_9974/m.22109 type:complete len:137 (+) Transcript_9974:94-504(+)